MKLARSFHRAADDLAGRVIAAHGVNENTHSKGLLQLVDLRQRTCRDLAFYFFPLDPGRSAGNDAEIDVHRLEIADAAVGKYTAPARRWPFPARNRPAAAKSRAAISSEAEHAGGAGFHIPSSTGDLSGEGNTRLSDQPGNTGRAFRATANRYSGASRRSGRIPAPRPGARDHQGKPTPLLKKCQMRLKPTSYRATPSARPTGDCTTA